LKVSNGGEKKNKNQPTPGEEGGLFIAPPMKSDCYNHFRSGTLALKARDSGPHTVNKEIFETEKTGFRPESPALPRPESLAVEMTEIAETETTIT
jgi:hypothetical protein